MVLYHGTIRKKWPQTNKRSQIIQPCPLSSLCGWEINKSTNKQELTVGFGGPPTICSILLDGTSCSFSTPGVQGCRFGPKNPSRQTLVSPICRSSSVPSVADCFRRCLGDKSASLRACSPEREFLLGVNWGIVLQAVGFSQCTTSSGLFLGILAIWSGATGTWQPCSVPGTNVVKLLVGPTCRIPWSTQRG